MSLRHSLKGPDGSLALDVMARSLAYVVLLAGLPAIPFLDDLLDEWEKFFGTPVRSNMRKTLRDAGRPVFEKMGMAGIPALMGIDISGSLKTGIPLLGSGTPQDTIYGVYGGLARWLKRFERVHPREKAVARKSPESMIPGETESEPL